MIDRLGDGHRGKGILSLRLLPFGNPALSFVDHPDTGRESNPTRDNPLNELRLPTNRHRIYDKLYHNQSILQTKRCITYYGI